MRCPIPFQARLIVIGNERSVLQSVFLKQVEEILIASMSQRFKLVIVPLLLEYIFDIAVLHATLCFYECFGTIAANECTYPNNGVVCFVLLAVNTEVIKWVSNEFIEIRFEFCWLLHIARLKTLNFRE